MAALPQPADPGAILDDLIDDEEEAPKPERGRELLGGRKSSPLKSHLKKILDQVLGGFEAQKDRADDQLDYWNCYNCELDANQFYTGNAQIYVPIIYDAVEALTTRWVNQMFPSGGRYVEAVSDDGHEPFEIIALLDHYIRINELKTSVFKPLTRNGIVEGQYNVYLDWDEVERQIVSRETHGPRDPQSGAELPGDDIDDIVEEEIVEGCPGIEVLHDGDVVVLPATAPSVEKALQRGGSVTIVRRWSEAQVQRMIDDGEIRESEGKNLIAMMSAEETTSTTREIPSVEKVLAGIAGIKLRGKAATVLETWTMLPLGGTGGYAKDGKRRMCRVYYAPDETPLGCKRNPYWNDRCPLLSKPLQKVAGVFKGDSLISRVAAMQYEANDCANRGADSATYSALPIIARDPEKYNGPLILNMAAIWDIDPNSIKFMEFPKLWQDAIPQIQSYQQQIFQALGVNPAMLPQQTGRPGAKRNQAEIALETQVDLLTTAEAVSVLEEGVATPTMQMWVDYDHQFRDRPLSIRAFGMMGKRATMEEIPPLQTRTRYWFRWQGVEQAKNAAQVQQQIAWINVVRGMKPDLEAEGYRLKLGPIIESSALSVFGARMAPTVLEDARAQLSLNPQIENELMSLGHIVPVQALDNDMEHIQAHMPAAQAEGDPAGQFRIHLAAHLKQMQMKQQMAVQAQIKQAMTEQGGQPQPGRGRQTRGGAPPRQGAQPSQPRLIKGPVGAVRQDALPKAGATVPPRHP
jgi:hypothetical protein